MSKPSIGVLGATSMVGQSLLPLLAGAGYRVIAYSRRAQPQQRAVEFRQTHHDNDTISDNEARSERIAQWICLAPIWTLPEHFPMLDAHRPERIVALSSTSVFTKQHSSDPGEQQTAEKLAQGEREVIAWAESNRIEWVILRPTLIYGRGQDRNICEIARFITRFGFFPLFGAARGLRQPVHAEDVAAASMAAMKQGQACNRAYAISGAERLTYREMVARVFKAMGRPERYIRIPLSLFRAAILCLRVLSRFRHWSAAMAERMEDDMAFEHAEAARDFGFSPRPFQLDRTDVPHL